MFMEMTAEFEVLCKDMEILKATLQIKKKPIRYSITEKYNNPIKNSKEGLITDKSEETIQTKAQRNYKEGKKTGK